MMSHKTKILLMTLMILVTFNGCAQININTGIDENYNSHVMYTVDVDVTAMDKEQAASVIDMLDKTINYYESKLGFVILERETYLSKDVCRYRVIKDVANDNYEEAFTTLQGMLTDESITPFMQVDMTSKVTEYQQFYSFKGELDFETIYKTTNIGSFPPYLQDVITKQFESCEGKVTISLPGTDLEKAAGGEVSNEDGHISMTVPIEFSQKKEIELSTRLTTNGGTAINKSMERYLRELDTGIGTWAIVGGTAFIAIIIGIVLCLRKGKVVKESLGTY